MIILYIRGKVNKSNILIRKVKNKWLIQWVWGGEKVDYIKVAEKKIDEFAEFLQHNINLGYITRETTVDELLMLLQNIREGYLPLQRDIEKLLQNYQLKG